MGKFYVQSGTVRSIVEAESASKAALWAVHQVMQQILPLDTEQIDNEATGSDVTPRRVLAKRIHVNECGFDRDDAVQLPTLQVVSQWNDMVNALDRLERLLYRAA